MEKLLNKKTAFHIHTKYSIDSNLNPEDIVDFLIMNKYDQVVITDHDSIEGAIVAKEYSQSRYGDKFHVIIGEEISTDIGHIIGFPLQNLITQNNYEECFSKIKEQNGFICLPHPYKQHDMFDIHIPSVVDSIDFVETFNSRVTQDQNRYASKYADYFKINKIIGSDAHIHEELNNTSFSFTTPGFKIRITKNGYSNIKNIRTSQYVKYRKLKHYPRMLKYFILGRISR